MPRYIDADELLERMKRTPRYFDVKHDIEEMPTADVVVGVEGEWIEHIEKPSWLEDDVEVFYNCSVCGTSHWSITPPFCPNCGAKMKGAGDVHR